MDSDQSRFAQSLWTLLFLFLGTVWLLLWAISTTHAQKVHPLLPSVTIDTIPPNAPVLLTPQDGVKINSDSPSFTWSVPSDSGGSGIENYRIYIDDEPAFSTPRIKAYTTSNTHYTPSLYEGIFFWKVYAKDRAGNQSNWSPVWRLEIDTTRPHSVCSAPQYEHGDFIPVDWTASDSAGCGLAFTTLFFKYTAAGVWACHPGDSATVTSGTFHFHPSEGDGQYHFRTIATDSAGNREHGPFGNGCDSTLYDTRGPQVSNLLTPADSTYTNDVTPTLSWSSALEPSPGSGIKNYRILIDDESGFSTPYVKSYYTADTSYTPNLPEGHYFWKVIVRDNANNTSDWSNIWKFDIDTIPPEIIYNYPSPGGTTPWYASDPGSLIDIDFTLNGGSPLDYARYHLQPGDTWHFIFSDDRFSDYTPEWDVEWNEIEACKAYITIESADVAGNSVIHSYHAGSSGFLFQKDPISPAITCPSDISIPCDPGTCTASGVYLDTVTVSDNCDSAPRVSYDAPSVFPVGSNAVTWTATDSAGNSNSCTQRVVVYDNEGPTISLTTPDELCWNTPPQLPRLQFSDNCGLHAGRYRIDSNPWLPIFTENAATQMGYSPWCLPESLFISLPEGSHTIEFAVTDDIGNEGRTAEENSWTFTKDTTPPQGPLNVPSSSHTPGAWSNIPKVELTWLDAPDTSHDCGLLGCSICWDSHSASIPEADMTINFVSASVGSTFQILPEGCWYVHMRNVDEAGNWQPASQTIHCGPFCIDQTKPSCAIRKHPSVRIGVCDETEICFTGEDNLSPHDSLRFSYMLVGVDPGPSEWSTAQAVTYTIPEGTHTFWVWARDLAGNVSASDECTISTRSGYCVKGDVNGDCHINVLDVALCARLILTMPTAPSEEELCRTDCYEDGVINILDALWIANTILEIGE